MRTQGFCDVTSLQRVLESLTVSHPEHTPVIQASAPLLVARQRLLAEYALRRKVKAREQVPLIELKELSLCLKTIGAMTTALLEAMAQGFPNMRVEVERLGERIKPADMKKLCQGFLGQEDASLVRYAKEKGVSEEVLRVLVGQVSQVLAARAVNTLPEYEGKETTGLCPYCGSHPDLSVIHTKEGQRALFCSCCGRHWRFQRTACPACGKEEPKNLELLYADKTPEERAVLCAACKHYILEVDIREKDIALACSHSLILGLGYLDILLQERGALPVMAG